MRAGLVKVFGAADPAVLSDAAASITLADCPGGWLRAAVELEICRAEPAAPASAEHDVGHVGFLPYVGILFADERVAQYAAQVLRRPDCLESLRGCPLPSRASTVPDILRAIRAHTPTAGEPGDAP